MRSMMLNRGKTYRFLLIINKKLQDSTTFANFAPMKRKIRTYGGYFEAFMQKLTEKEQENVQYGLLLLKTQKTPQGEIEKALKIKEAYYADKQSQNH